ncbi:response regulator receiver protein [Stanieria sp. NIES-3757]|nr:response regulator receiver protein [Stanieria sp. NIES-3757]
MTNDKIVDILLIEDSYSDAYLTQETLSESSIPHQIHWVKNGVEAIDFLKRQGDYTKAPRPDLILLDLNLPKKNGREVLSQIKKDEHLKTIPAIVLTTSADERDILGSYQLQANCYLIKPLDLEDFITLIQSIDRFWLTAVIYPAKP